MSTKRSFEADATGGMDIRYDKAGNDEGKCGNDKGDEIDKNYERPRKEYGNLTDIIRRGIETYEAQMLLKQGEADAENIADEHSAPDDEDGIIDEKVAKTTVCGSQGLHYTDELRTFEDDDKQTANRRKAGNGHHEQ